MRKDNRWQHGLRDFRFPRMPSELITPGCSFYRATFDADIGEEVFVFLKDDPAYAEQLAALRPMTLFAHKGIVSTPYGVVAYVVWQIAAGTPQETLVETFFNPFEFGTLKLLSDAANQSHLKFVAIDPFTQEVLVMVDFENVFEIDSLLFHAVMNIGHAAPTDFRQATRFIMENSPTEELMEMAVI